MATDVELAWMAGFFDGEGTVIVERSKSPACTHGYQTSLHVAVTQTSTPCLEIFKSHFGGSIITSRSTTPNGRRWAVQHRWVVRNEAALAFLRTIAPYVVVKRDQVAAAAQYPMYDANGRKYGSRKSPLPDAVFSARLALREALKRMRAESKEMAEAA